MSTPTALPDLPIAGAPLRARAARGEGARLRAEILDAAERLLIQSGDDTVVSIRSIAAEVGVTPPSIYLHFASKEALVFAVCDRCFAAFDAAVEGAGASTDDPIETHRRRAHAYVRFGLDHPGHYRLLFMGRRATRALDPDDGLTAAQRAFAHLVEAVQRSIDLGAFRAGVDPLMAAIGMWTAIHGLTAALIALPGFPWPNVDHLVDQLCDTHLHALTSEARQQGVLP